MIQWATCSFMHRACWLIIIRLVAWQYKLLTILMAWVVSMRVASWKRGWVSQSPSGPMCIHMHKACVLQRQSQVSCHEHAILGVNCNHKGPSFNLTEVLLTYRFGVVHTKQDTLLCCLHIKTKIFQVLTLWLVIPRSYILWKTHLICSLCSFGNFPGVRSIKADVSELNVGSIILGNQE
jgi:hypothetical protein